MSNRALLTFATVAGFVLLAMAPFVVPAFYLTLLMKAVIFALFAMSFDLLVGYLGLVSLGHAAYFGISAYTLALMSQAGVDNVALQVVLSVFAAAVLSIAFGLLSLRTRGVYHFMLTLALAQVLWSLAFGWRSVTGGDDGLTGIRAPTFGWGDTPYGETAFYFFVVIMSMGGMAALFAVARSPLGRVLIGVRDNEQRMMVLGYNVQLYQLAGMTIAGIGAGLAGVLFAYSTGYVGVSYLGIALSADVLLMVIIGGAGTMIGPAFGAILLIALQAVVSSTTQHWAMVVGAIYVVMVLWAPGGVAGLLDRLTKVREA